MPGYKTHIKIGFIFAIIFSCFIGYLLFNKFKVGWDIRLLYSPFVIYVYAQLPDLDSHTSKIRRYTFIVIFSGLALSSILVSFLPLNYSIIVFSILGVLGLALFTIRHRGPMHSYLFILVASLPILFIHWYLFLLAFVAGSSHIFIDRLRTGLKKKVIRKFYIRTNVRKHMNTYLR